MGALIRRLEAAAMTVAGACVTAMMLVVCVDAAGRYLFRAPLQWSFDVVSYYLMVGAAYFALSSTFRHGDHININLLHAKLSPRVRAWVDIVTSVLAAVLFAVIAYTAFDKTIDAWTNKEFSPGYVMWPVWLSFAPIPLGAGLIVLRLLHHGVMLAVHGADPNVLSDAEAGGAE
jgi:TRAP-type C4-dicarboxylate transport system permease small subunit